jgi:hypothetical protein
MFRLATWGSSISAHYPIKIWVFARKIEDGFAAFDPTERAEIVNLTPENPLARVIINLGRRQGVVIPKVRDKVTGQVIRKFALRWLTYHEQGGWSGAADFSGLIRRTSLPVERNLRIEVSAKAYRDWLYTNAGQPSPTATLRLKCGEIRTLDIELERAGKRGTNETLR